MPKEIFRLVAINLLSQALCGLLQLRPAAIDQWQESCDCLAVASLEGIVREQIPQHGQVVIIAKVITQGVSLFDEFRRDSWPKGLDKLQLVPEILGPLAPLL